MAEDSTNPFAGFMAALQERGGTKNEKGVVRNKVNTVLSAEEKQRYTNIFKLMGEILNPKEEVEKVQDLSKKELPGAATQITNNTSGTGSGTGDGMGGILSMIGAGLIGTAVAFVTDKVDLLKMAAKVAKFIPIKLLKGLPLIGSILNFGFAYQAFQEGKIGKGLWELTSGIANLFPGVGTAISLGMDMIMYMFEKEEAAAEERGEKLNFGTWLKDKTIEMGTIVWQKLKDGKIPLLSGLFKFGEGIGYFLAGKWSAGLDSWCEILPAFFGMGGDGQEDFWAALDAIGQLLGDGVSAMDKGAEMVMGKDVWGWMKDMFKEVGTVLSDIWDGAVGWVKNIGGAAKQGLYDSLPTALQDLWTGATGYDPDKEAAEARRKEYESNKANEILKQEAVSKARAEIGEEAYHKITMFPKGMKAGTPEYNQWKQTKSDFLEGAFSKYGPKIEDGIIMQNGRSTRIDSKDSVLAAKPGGPIEKMLDQNSAIQAQQLNVLREIRDGIISLKSAGGTSFADTSLISEFYA